MVQKHCQPSGGLGFLVAARMSFARSSKRTERSLNNMAVEASDPSFISAILAVN
jgi:hypothetical protein